ncbi:MAG: alpha/beta hydrolase [Mariniblastus sp.]
MPFASETNPILIAIFFSVCICFCVTSTNATLHGQEAKTKTTEIYKEVGARKLKILISKPADWKASDTRPAAVFFHGGGWVGGKPGQFDPHCAHLTMRGMVCFQVEYRLIPKGTENTDRTPTRCINDAKSAMRWVRSRASEFGIDPDRIASGGGSAGGHLAAFLGTTDGVDDPNDDQTVSARSNLMLLFNPVCNNGPGQWGASRVGDRYKEFSPAHNISSDDAPSIVFLGSKDKLIPVSTSQDFQNQMTAQHVRSELRIYAGAGHGFFNANKEGGKWYPLTIEEMDEFLVSYGWLN